MKLFIILSIIFGSLYANAGRCKLTWAHNYRGTDGSTVVLTGFNFYWTVNGSAETRITYGPPLPLPWKVENGIYTWSKTYDNTSWTPGSIVCFRATAIAGVEESARSNQVCKTMPVDPTEPTIIDITNP